MFDESALIDQALKALENAHAPYSRHPVGAAILSGEGHIYRGSNVENAAYPLGSCAEVGAIAAMVAAGERSIRTIVIVGPGESLCPPCGGCRQRIAEFADSATEVIMVSRSGRELRRSRLEALLPHAFSGAGLVFGAGLVSGADLGHAEAAQGE